MPRKKRSATAKDLDPRWTSDAEPAPGDLRIVQAFVDTAASDAGADGLASPRDLADWLARWGLLGAGTELDDADLERARAARAGLRALVSGNCGRAVDAKAVTTLDQAASETPFHLRFEAGVPARYEPRAGGLGGPLGRLLAIVEAEQDAGRWPRLKLCRARTCGAVFYDFSTNRSARWCSARCGNRLSARRSRRRYPKRF